MRVGAQFIGSKMQKGQKRHNCSGLQIMKLEKMQLRRKIYMLKLKMTFVNADGGMTVRLTLSSLVLVSMSPTGGHW